jgi:hypothetical protein
MSDPDLKCPHCGKEPRAAITLAMESCGIGDAFEALTKCDYCGGEIGVAVSKEANVNRRGKGYSDAELDQRG